MKNRVLDVSLAAMMTAALTAAICSGFDLDGAGAAGTAKIAAPVLIVTGACVWLLSLTRAGIAALFATGTLVCGGAAFLEFPVPVWADPLFGAACIATYLYRNYTLTLSTARSGSTARNGAGAGTAAASGNGAGKNAAPVSSRFFLQSGAVALAALLAAAGIWAGIVRPADPPVRDLDLVRALQQVQLMETLGIYSRQDRIEEPQAPEEQQEPDAQQDRVTEEQEQPEAQSQGAAGEVSEGGAGGDLGGSGAFDGSGLRWLWLLLLIPAAVALAYGLKAQSRKRWRDTVEACDPETAARNYYLFLLDRFGKMGIEKEDDVTLRQFAAGAADRTAVFAVEGADFEQLTAVYERLAYGGGSLRPGELEGFRAMYAGFYRTLGRELGTLKYVLQYFRY